MLDGQHLLLALPEDPLVRSAPCVAQQTEDGRLPAVGLDAELRPQRRRRPRGGAGGRPPRHGLEPSLDRC